MLIKINGKTYTYIVKKTSRKKVYIRVKEGIIVVSAPPFTSNKKIEELIINNQKLIISNLEAFDIEPTIHIKGNKYFCYFHVADRCDLLFDGDEVHIYAKKNEKEEYRKILYQYYKNIVWNEVLNLIPNAKNDFSEFVFPMIKISNMKTMFGNYYKKKHLIHISILLAKYDLKYIKYVLYHELTHVSIFNHSKEFYDFFESKYPNAKNTSKELKKIVYHDYL